MSTPTYLNKGKLAAGAAMVALSGFVPNPLMNEAQAQVSTNINVSGSFISGIAIGGTQSLNFGQVVATSTTGNIGLNSANIFNISNNALPVAGNQIGKITLTVAVKSAEFDITVTGFGTVGGFAATTGAAGPSGTASLSAIYFGGTGLNRQFDFTSGSTSANFTATGAGATTNQFCGLVEFDTKRPGGSFTTNITVTAGF